MEVVDKMRITIRITRGPITTLYRDQEVLMLVHHRQILLLDQVTDHAFQRSDHTIIEGVPTSDLPSSVHETQTCGSSQGFPLLPTSGYVERQACLSGCLVSFSSALSPARTVSRRARCSIGHAMGPSDDARRLGASAHGMNGPAPTLVSGRRLAGESTDRRAESCVGILRFGRWRSDLRQVARMARLDPAAATASEAAKV